jgi:hypothetical protein
MTTRYTVVVADALAAPVRAYGRTYADPERLRAAVVTARRTEYRYVWILDASELRRPPTARSIQRRVDALAEWDPELPVVPRPRAGRHALPTPRDRRLTLRIRSALAARLEALASAQGSTRHRLAERALETGVDLIEANSRLED